MEAACEEALQRGSASYQGVKALLILHTNTAPATPAEPEVPPVRHDNIRGAGYYASASVQPQEAQTSTGSVT